MVMVMIKGQLFIDDGGGGGEGDGDDKGEGGPNGSYLLRMVRS